MLVPYFGLNKASGHYQFVALVDQLPTTIGTAKAMTGWLNRDWKDFGYRVGDILIIQMYKHLFWLSK